jgi:hypothetical protein
MPCTETPNWLSEIIEGKRRTIDRAFPRRLRQAACDGIIAAIQTHPNGALLAANEKLEPVVLEALDVAAAVERAQERDSNLTSGSPAIQASWLVFDKLGLMPPEPAS